MAFGFLKKIRDGIVRAGTDFVGKITIVVNKKQPNDRSTAPQDQRSVHNHGMKVENREPFKGFVDSGGVRGSQLKNHATT